MSFINRGMNKAILYLLGNEEGDEGSYVLTFRQAKALLQGLEYLRWQARHISLPSDLSSQDALNQWVTDLEVRLTREYTPMSEICSEIINCIGTDDDVKQAFRDFIMGDTILNQWFQDKIIAFNKQIEPLQPVITTDSLDKLWAQCVQIVEYTNDAISQLLEVLETQSNNLELIKLSLESIPMFGYILNVVPADEWLGFADYWIEIIGEQYASGYTDTIPDGLKWRLACEIFCRCKDDLKVTVNRIWDAIAFFLSPFTAISWDNASELVESVIGVNDNSEVVTLATFAIMFGTAKLANRFGLSTITSSVLGIILKLAENDANNDWEILCEECNDEEPVGTCIDFKTMIGTWKPANFAGEESSAWGVRVSGEGLAPNQDTGNIYWWRDPETEGILQATFVSFTFNKPVTNFVWTRSNYTQYFEYTGTPITVITFNIADYPEFLTFDMSFPWVATFLTNNVSDHTIRIEEFCYTEYVE